MSNLEGVMQVLSDQYLFPLLQVVLFFVLVLSLVMEFVAQKRAGFGGTKLVVTRSQTSMNMYYGTYAAISGVLVALCLSVEVAKEHRNLGTLPIFPVFAPSDTASQCPVFSWSP